MVIFQSYDTLKVGPLKMNFLKILVLSCGDYKLIRRVFSNCFQPAKENQKNMVIFKSYDTLKDPFENEFSQDPRVIVRRLLAHEKGL